MNLRKTAVLSVVALMVGALGSTLAEARPGYRGGGGRAFFYAAPIAAAGILASRYYYRPSYYYYPPSYYYPPAYYYYPPSPPVYIEQGPAPSYAVPPQSQYQQPQYEQPQYEQPQVQQPQTQPRSQPYQPAPQADAYYCPESRAYYPQVQICSGGWQRVTPQARAN